MAIAQIKNLQRRLANMESEATAALDRACGNSLWASIGPDAIDGLEDPGQEVATREEDGGRREGQRMLKLWQMWCITTKISVRVLPVARLKPRA